MVIFGIAGIWELITYATWQGYYGVWGQYVAGWNTGFLIWGIVLLVFFIFSLIIFFTRIKKMVVKKLFD
jgi:hypothetical protein